MIVRFAPGAGVPVKRPVPNISKFSGEKTDKKTQNKTEQKLATTALDEIRAGKVTEKTADMASKLKDEKAKEDKAKKHDNS